MGEEEDSMAGSELLLPAVRGASENDQLLSENHRQNDDEESDGRGDDDRLQYDGGSVLSLQSHVTSGSLPSYMRAKSGVEMDPDRVSFVPFCSCNASLALSSLEKAAFDSTTSIRKMRSSTSMVHPKHYITATKKIDNIFGTEE